MRNVNVVVKPDETVTDIIEQICLSENIKCDDLFAFSCIMTEEADGYQQLKINCLEPAEDNPYTPVSLITSLFTSKNVNPRYVVAPLEQYLTAYRPMLHKMVNKAHPYYQNLMPDKEDLMSILFLTIVRLNDKGYYLHNHLIYKSFVNELNKEVRKLKHFDNMRSLDEPVGQTDDGSELTLLHMLPDPDAHQFAEYTLEDYWRDMFEQVKAAMLEDMSQLAFDRILIQLKSQTIDTPTSRVIAKYRDIFNPGYIPRPNARGKAKGGNKKC